MYRPEKKISSTSFFSESGCSDDSSKESNQLENTSVGNRNWYNCGKCVSEKKKTDCLCCQYMHAFSHSA